MQVNDVSGGEVFLRSSGTPILSVDTLERNASRGHGLVTSVAAGNNILLVGTNTGWIVRHDFSGGDANLGSCCFLFDFGGCIHAFCILIEYQII